MKPLSRKVLRVFTYTRMKPGDRSDYFAPALLPVLSMRGDEPIPIYYTDILRNSRKSFGRGLSCFGDMLVSPGDDKVRWHLLPEAQIEQYLAELTQRERAATEYLYAKQADVFFRKALDLSLSKPK